MRQEGAAGPAATITYMNYTRSGGDGHIFEVEDFMGKKKKRSKQAGRQAAKAKAEKKQPKKRGK